MKKILEVAGFLLFVWGASGVLHELTGWFKLWGVVRRLDFLDGYELYASIVPAVLGVALMTAADRAAEVRQGDARVPAGVSSCPSRPLRPPADGRPPPRAHSSDG